VAWQVLIHPQQFKELEVLYNEQLRLDQFLNKDGEYRGTTKEAILNMTKGKGWQILEAYMVNLVQTTALNNMREFELNAESDDPKQDLTIRQTYMAGLIRGCQLVINFPVFVENHFKLNELQKDIENG